MGVVLCVSIFFICVAWLLIASAAHDLVFAQPSLPFGRGESGVCGAMQCVQSVLRRSCVLLAVFAHCLQKETT